MHKSVLKDKCREQKFSEMKFYKNILGNKADEVRKNIRDIVNRTML